MRPLRILLAMFGGTLVIMISVFGSRLMLLTALQIIPPRKAWTIDAQLIRFVLNGGIWISIGVVVLIGFQSGFMSGLIAPCLRGLWIGIPAMIYSFVALEMARYIVAPMNNYGPLVEGAVLRQLLALIVATICTFASMLLGAILGAKSRSS